MLAYQGGLEEDTGASEDEVPAYARGDHFQASNEEGSLKSEKRLMSIHHREDQISEFKSETNAQNVIVWADKYQGSVVGVFGGGAVQVLPA